MIFVSLSPRNFVDDTAYSDAHESGSSTKLRFKRKEASLPTSTISYGCRYSIWGPASPSNHHSHHSFCRLLTSLVSAVANSEERCSDLLLLGFMLLMLLGLHRQDPNTVTINTVEATYRLASFILRDAVVHCKPSHKRFLSEGMKQ